MSITEHPRVPVVYILIFFVIVVGIVLLVTLDSSSYHKTHIKSIADLHPKLCVKKLKERGSKLRDCPKNGIVSVEQAGKLANQIWEYATVWAVSKKTGLEPFIPRCIKNRLQKVFQDITMPSLDEISHCSVDVNDYVRSLEDWNLNQSIIMEKWNSEQYLIALYADDLEDHFVYKKELIDKAENVFQNVSGNIENTTFVGIHIRRTKYIRHLGRTRGAQYLTNFYKKAMLYFQNKFENVKFVVVSEDTAWCKQFFENSTNVYVSDLSMDEGMVLLSNCDHSIFDFGSFGTWAALYAGGETYYLDPKGTSFEVTPSVSDLRVYWHKM